MPFSVRPRFKPPWLSEIPVSTPRSALTIARLKEAWSQEHARWQKRDLSAKRYLYFWVDGILG
jgi:hypothetical protein